MLRFGEAKVAKEKFYTSQKNNKILGVNINNIFI